MAEMLIQSESLTAIADKIRVLSGTEDSMGLDDMAAHIGEANSEVATQTELIAQIASALEGKAGGNVPEPVIEPLEITENGIYTVPDRVDGYSPVTVNVPIPDGYIKPNGTFEITENGTHDVAEYAEVHVDVPNEEPVLQEKTVIENGVVTPDEGCDGLSKVTVNVPTGGNGNTSINTGSVTVKYISEAAAIYFVHCIRYVDGEINYHEYDSNGDLLPDDNKHTFPDSKGYYYGPIEFTIPDVVENSFFIISGEGMSSIEVNNETDIEEMKGYYGDPIVFFYKTGNATITITADY